MTNSYSYTYDHSNGGYFHIVYTFQMTLVEDLSIEVTLTQTLYDDGSGNVPMGMTWSGTATIEYSGFSYHNGAATFTVSATNSRQTG